MKVEIFEDGPIRDDINKWLADNPGITIKHITQSETGASNGQYSRTIIVWYEERLL